MVELLAADGYALLSAFMPGKSSAVLEESFRRLSSLYSLNNFIIQLGRLVSDVTAPGFVAYLQFISNGPAKYRDHDVVFDGGGCSFDRYSVHDLARAL